MEQIFKRFALLGLMCITRVVADDCAPYVDSNFVFQRGQTCILSFCAGSCTNRYCSIIPGTMLDQSQFLCLLNNLYVVIGAGIVISLLIIAGVITCFCKSLCLCCDLCRPQSRQAHLNSSVAVTNIVPQQPLLAMSPAVYQPVPNPSMHFKQPGNDYLPPPYPGADNVSYEDSP